MKTVRDENAWSEYGQWQSLDRKIVIRIHVLLTDISRNGNEGIGKPEALKHEFQGSWSRRITHEHRLIYTIAGTK